MPRNDSAFLVRLTMGCLPGMSARHLCTGSHSPPQKPPHASGCHLLTAVQAMAARRSAHIHRFPDCGGHGGNLDKLSICQLPNFFTCKQWLNEAQQASAGGLCKSMKEALRCLFWCMQGQCLHDAALRSAGFWMRRAWWRSWRICGGCCLALTRGRCCATTRPGCSGAAQHPVGRPRTAEVFKLFVQANRGRVLHNDASCIAAAQVRPFAI